MLGANELMNSRLSGSEEALARLTIERLQVPAPRVLIGGLGLGFTLRAALPLLPPAAKVTVVETRAGGSSPGRAGRFRSPAWRMPRRYKARHDSWSEDVARLIQAAKVRLVMPSCLDVDNGPRAFSR